MRQHDPRPFRPRRHVAEHIAHDLADGFLPRLGQLHAAMLRIGGNPLRRPVPGKGLRRRPLPVFPLPAHALKLNKADALRHRPERRPGVDRLQLFRIADQNQFRPGRLRRADKRRQLL